MPKLKNVGILRRSGHLLCILSEICYFLHNEIKGFSSRQCFPYSHRDYLKASPGNFVGKSQLGRKGNRTAASGCSLGIAPKHQALSYFLFSPTGKKKK